MKPPSPEPATPGAAYNKTALTYSSGLHWLTATAYSRLWPKPTSGPAFSHSRQVFTHDSLLNNSTLHPYYGSAFSNPTLSLRPSFPGLLLYHYTTGRFPW
jgi:hypothetical protein